MKIGVIVDGKAEPEALLRLRGKVHASGPFLKPLYVDLQPMAPPGLVAKRARRNIDTLRARGAQRIVLLIDREERQECAPELAARIAEALGRRGESGVTVVVKDRALENWLVADPDCFAALSARFHPPKSFARRVSPNKADSVRDAAFLLNRIAVRRPYHKRHDPARILAALDVTAAAKNSRSFRRFLRAMGDRRYRDQSRLP